MEMKHGILLNFYFAFPEFLNQHFTLEVYKNLIKVVENLNHFRVAFGSGNGNFSRLEDIQRNFRCVSGQPVGETGEQFRIPAGGDRLNSG